MPRHDHRLLMPLNIIIHLFYLSERFMFLFNVPLSHHSLKCSCLKFCNVISSSYLCERTEAQKWKIRGSTMAKGTYNQRLNRNFAIKAVKLGTLFKELK